jgi:hypothetical protein
MKDLLLQLCRYPYDPANRENLATLLKNISDWGSTARLINDHGIIALAAYNIKEAELEDLVPLKAWRTIDNGYRQSVVRNAWLTQRWKEVNDILNNAGIKHVLLKGMALEYSIYGARGLRQMNDTDILIRPDEAEKAWYLLQRNGFTIYTPKSPLHLKIMKKISYHLPALYKDGYSLEIHTRLEGYTMLSDKTDQLLFDNTREININNEKALILKDDLHLKYLISHFQRHAISGECQIRIYADILMLGGKNVEYPESFILKPDQKGTGKFKKASFKNKLQFMPPMYRIPYLVGDLFPSLKWMKERYGCSGLRAMMHYPHRMGKLWWLV